jgi:hypothetical protein
MRLTVTVLNSDAPVTIVCQLVNRQDGEDVYGRDEPIDIDLDVLAGGGHPPQMTRQHAAAHVEHPLVLADVRGFHETFPIRHAEQAYGFAEVGQTIINAPDAKVMRVYVDDEPLDFELLVERDEPIDIDLDVLAGGGHPPQMTRQHAAAHVEH